MQERASYAYFSTYVCYTSMCQWLHIKIFAVNTMQKCSPSNQFTLTVGQAACGMLLQGVMVLEVSVKSFVWLSLCLVYQKGVLIISDQF